MSDSLHLKHPIFLLASERSGSNLIRVILGHHPRVAAPPPPHLIDNFIPLLPLYGDLAKKDNFRELCDDVVKAIEVQVGDWERSASTEELVENIEHRDFIHLFDYLFHKELKARDKPRIFIKSNYLFNYTYYLMRHYPQSRFIYLIRDARDFTLSYLKSVSHFETLQEVAERWQTEQRTCLSLYQQLKDDDCIFPIHYEDLLQFSEESVQEICRFLGEDFDEQMLQYHQKEENISDAQKIKDWENIQKPIQSSNYAKYKDGLSRKAIQKVESIAYREMQLCGYPLENDPSRLGGESTALNFIQKGWAVFKNLLKGKFISISELKLRQQRFSTLNQIVEKRSQAIEPVLECKVVKNNLF